MANTKNDRTKRKPATVIFSVTIPNLTADETQNLINDLEEYLTSEQSPITTADEYDISIIDLSAKHGPKHIIANR